MPQIHDNPKEAAQAYITHLEVSYYKWYKKSVTRNYVLWLCCQLLSLIACFGTAVLAALFKKNLLEGEAIPWIIVVLPFFGAIASTVIVQSRVYDRWRVREEGRIAFQTLVTEARRRFAAVTSPSNYTQLHKGLGDETVKIEREQSTSFFAMAPSLTK